MSLAAAFFAQLATGFTPVEIPTQAPAGILQNPDFNAMGGWLSTSGTQLYLSSGVLYIANSSGNFFYQPWYNFLQTPVAGANYRLFLLINTLSSGAIRVVSNSALSTPDGTVTLGLDETFYNAGYYVRDFIHDGDTLNIQSVNYLAMDCNAEVEFIQVQRLLP